MTGNTNNSRLRSIESLAQSNRETIAMLNSHPRSVIQQVTYRIIHSNGRFSVHEQKIEQYIKSILNSWQGVVNLEVIPDMFNDRISYSCSSYQDIQKLNEQMLSIAQKYEVFGDSERAQQEIRKLEHNFVKIQSALKELVQLAKTGGGGHLSSIQEQVDNVNNQLKVLQNTHKNITFE
jgi:hypothetical protein